MAGPATGLVAGTASAGGVPDDDLAYARLLVAAELLGADFFTHALKQPLACIAASEAERLGVFTQLAGGTPFELSFPEALTIEEASNALDAYTS